jgi:glyoxylase-like metal-dependent hydrolase (beta-lactamase superfamily II)
MARAQDALQPEVRVRGFSTGRVRPKMGDRGPRRYLPGGWSPRTLPVNVFVVEHPGGLCLFDAGQTALASRRGYLPPWHPFLRLARFELGRQDEAVAQLRLLGHSPQDVRWIVLSHLHTDHAGGVGDFPHAEVVVSRVEWDRATGLSGRVRGYLPQHWPAGLRPRLVDFDGPPVGPFEASCDIAGDRRMLAVPTPGHTPGHLAMLVCQDDRVPWMCVGDLVHDPSDLERTAPDIHEFCLEEGTRVLATHDPLATAAESGG